MLSIKTESAYHLRNPGHSGPPFRLRGRFLPGGSSAGRVPDRAGRPARPRRDRGAENANRLGGSAFNRNGAGSIRCCVATSVVGSVPLATTAASNPAAGPAVYMSGRTVWPARVGGRCRRGPWRGALEALAVVEGER